MESRLALTGNQAAATAVKLCRVQLVTSYPITPQTTIMEEISKIIANGDLEAEYITSEGEHPMVGQAIGAALTGIRVFTSTSSQGLFFGFENIAWIPGVRLPIVMAVVNRSTAMPLDMYCDHSDSMTVRDQGWIQLYAESAQEVLDSLIQAYRIAEDPSVLLPVMVCYDGFSVSHTTEIVKIPEASDVDKFLPIYDQNHIRLDPDNPMEIVGILPPEKGMAYEMLKNSALESSAGVIQVVNDEYRHQFGREYGDGLIETEYCEDANFAVVTIGSISGNARAAVRKLRSTGQKAGFIRIRSFRPFPKQVLLDITSKLKALAVVDRNLTKGLGEGVLFTEIKSTLFDMENRPKVLGFISGLHGVETYTEDFEYILNKTAKYIDSKDPVPVEWIPNFDIELEEVKSPILNKSYFPGTTTCPGCNMALIFRKALDVLGKNIVVIRTAGCQAWQSSIPGKTLLNIPLGRSVLPGGAACASGVQRGLKILGKKDAHVLLFGGDGSIGDMGFLALSGAAERNEDFSTIVYDNEAYANTGLQRSGSTPRWAWTSTTPVGPASRGNKRPKKDLCMIMAAHGVPYVAAASVSYSKDYISKIEKSTTIEGFRYIHVLCPCSPSWKFPIEKSVELGRLAVQTGMWILFEIENGILKINVKPKKLKPIESYLKLQGRFRHLNSSDIKEIQYEVEKRWELLLSIEEANKPLPHF